MIRNLGIGVKKRLNPLNNFTKGAELQIHFLQIFSAFQRKFMYYFCAEKLKIQRILAHFIAI